MGGGRLRRARFGVVALIVAACGATAPPASPQGATPGASGSAISIDPGPPTGASDFAGLAAAEDRIRAADRATAGVNDGLGPDAAAILAAVDQARIEFLARTFKPRLLPSSPAGVLTEGRALVVLAAAAAPARREAARPAIGGEAASGALTLAMTVVEDGLNHVGIDQATPDVSTSTTQEVKVKGNTVNMTFTASARVAESGTKLTGDASVDVVITVTDDATGQVTATIKEHAQGLVEVEFCPDQGGVARGKFELTDSLDYFGKNASGQEGRSVSTELKSAFRLIVNDKAVISSVEIDASVDRSGKGGKKLAGAGQSDLHVFQVGLTLSEAFSMPSGERSAYDAHLTRIDGATQEDVDPAVGLAGNTAVKVAILIGKDAENDWQAGSCVEIVVLERGSASVKPDQHVKITAKPYHKFDKADLDKPMTATLSSGSASVSPADSPVPPHATFEYVAGHKSGDAGAVMLRSVSNLGIGELELQFKVQERSWSLDVDGVVHQALSLAQGGVGLSWKVDLKVKATQAGFTSSEGAIKGIVIKQGIAEDGPSPVSIAGPATMAIGDTTCHATYNQTEQLRILGTVDGEELVLRFEIPDQNVHSKATCPTNMGPMTFERLGAGGFGNRWAQTIGEIRVLVDGGTVTASKSGSVGGIATKASGTFTVTPVP